MIFDTGPRIRTKNIGNLLALDTADFGQCPTRWQKSLYPQVYQPKLHIVHEGIDIQVVSPYPTATFTIPDTDIHLSCEDEVVTYVSRNLEPYRGFPSFMRSLPAILVKRPNARLLIVGRDDVSYGPKPENGKPFRAQLLEELGSSLDLSRVHFLGKVPYSSFIKILQISTAYVYLTYPFVLSWSMLEAMSAGCLIIDSRTQPVEEVIADEQALIKPRGCVRSAGAQNEKETASESQFLLISKSPRKTINSCWTQLILIANLHMPAY